MIHQQILSDLDVKHTPLVLIDSTALRSSIYDQQAKRGMSTRHKWYKGYKLHLATISIGIVLVQELTTANVYDSDAVPDLLIQLTDFNIQMMIGDTAYDSKKVRKQSEEHSILFFHPLILEKVVKEKILLDGLCLKYSKRPLVACF